MSNALAPDRSFEGLRMTLRIVSGAVLTSGMYWLFQQPGLRDLNWLVRWPLMLVCAVSLTVDSLLLMQGVGVGTAMNWTGDSPLAQNVPRVAAGIHWCTVCFGFELFDGLYAADLSLARQRSIRHARKRWPTCITCTGSTLR
jgi:hypothetical protein